MLKKLQPQFELFLKVFRAAQLINGAELKIFLKIYVKSIFEFYLMLHYYSLIKKVAGVLPWFFHTFEKSFTHKDIKT